MRQVEGNKQVIITCFICWWSALTGAGDSPVKSVQFVEVKHKHKDGLIGYLSGGMRESNCALRAPTLVWSGEVIRKE